MRARFAAPLLLAAGLAGCGHHAAAIPHLGRIPPTGLGRTFLADLPGKSSPRYIRLVRREALAARAEPVDVRAAGGVAVATLAVSDPVAFLNDRLQRFFDRTLFAHREEAYLRIVDSRGGRVLEWTHRGAGGSLWIRRDVRRCTSIQPIGVYGTTHPHCPA